MSPAAVRVRLVAVQEVPTSFLTMGRGLREVPIVPTDELRAIEFAVRVMVAPLSLPEAVRLIDDAVMLLVEKLMPLRAPEALRMREPVVVLSDRADAMVMSPAVRLREKVLAKFAGRAVRAPLSLVRR